MATGPKTMVNKTRHRKLKIEQQETPKNRKSPQLTWKSKHTSETEI
jgi:hypothetical protein